jgi:hypothetical protein
MNIDNWKYLYKIAEGGTTHTTNLLYTPMVNLKETIMCLIYDEEHEYQKDSSGLTKDLIDFFFEREVKYLEIFQSYRWAPKLLDVNFKSRTIFTEFFPNTINRILMDKNRNLDIEYPDWKDQIFAMLKDIDQAGYYKMALYPHCFFFDKNSQLKTIDFYSCVEKDNCLIPRNKVEGLIGGDSTGRFDTATVNGNVDFEIFFKTTMLTHLAQRWPDNPFPNFYKELKNV